MDPRILICGAGPTGLVLAIWLAKRKIPFRIIDKAAKAGTASRALVLHARTLEYYRMLDIDKAVTNASLHMDEAKLWVHQHVAGTIQFGGAATDTSPFPYVLVFPQDEHEALLEKELNALGKKVERGTELLTYREHPGGIDIRLRTASGDIENADFSWLAGCDGARSRVRELAGADFPGGTYEHTFYVADITGTGPVINGDLNIALDDADFLAVFPLKGEGRARLIGTVSDKKTPGAVKTPNPYKHTLPAPEKPMVQPSILALTGSEMAVSSSSVPVHSPAAPGGKTVAATQTMTQAAATATALAAVPLWAAGPNSAAAEPSIASAVASPAIAQPNPASAGHNPISAGRPEAPMPDTGEDHPLQWADVSHDIFRRINLDIRSVNWFSTYRVHHRVASFFRKGRVFLLGDAAHVHSPFGGQGMNTGIGDAINLAWKFEAVLRRGAPDSILDSYEQERIGFARRLVETTDRAFTFINRRSALATGIRTRIVPLLLPLVFKRPAFRRQLFRILSQTRITYRNTPLSTGVVGAIHSGDRLPWLRHADNFAPLKNLDWQLHCYGDARLDLLTWCERYKIPLHFFTPAEPFKPGTLCLVRPDGHIGWVGHSTDLSALSRYVTQWRIA
jgi:2-polyprenyl-6-methoxyphenol hydroxylase-like FAD-dependent oxidoreductase